MRGYRIFGPKREEVTGGWRKLHNKELHNMYSHQELIYYDDQIKEEVMGKAVLHPRRQSSS
jgi:hypothetical protein